MFSQIKVSKYYSDFTWRYNLIRVQNCTENIINLIIYIFRLNTLISLNLEIKIFFLIFKLVKKKLIIDIFVLFSSGTFTTYAIHIWARCI